MQHTMHLITTLVVILAALATPVGAIELDENFSMFAELVGKQWEGHFDDVEETMTLYMSWEPIIGGAAVEMKGWYTGSDMTRRNIYYWDREKKRVAYLAITSNGYVSTGSVLFEDSVLTFLGLQVFPDGSMHDTKACWEFLPDGKLRATGYRKQGDKWLAGHKILYKG